METWSDSFLSGFRWWLSLIAAIAGVITAVGVVAFFFTSQELERRSKQKKLPRTLALGWQESQNALAKCPRINVTISSASTNEATALAQDIHSHLFSSGFRSQPPHTSRSGFIRSRGVEVTPSKTSPKSMEAAEGIIAWLKAAGINARMDKDINVMDAEGVAIVVGEKEE